MADINFGILDTQMPGRIAAIPQQQQAQQAQNAMQLMQVQQSMNQNELAKYQLSSAKRADTEAEQLRLLYGGASATGMADPEFIRKIYAVNPTQGMALEKALADRAKSGLDVKNVTSQITERDLRVQQLRTEHAYESFSRLAAMPGGATNEAIDAAVADAVKNQGVGMQQGMQLGNQLKNLPLDKRAQVLGSLALKAEKRLELFAPKPTAVTTPSGGVSFVDTSGLSPTAGQTPAGFTNFAPGMTPYQTGQLGVSRGNLAATQARLTDEGISFGGAPAAAGAPVAAPVNALATPPAAPVNAMIPRPATPAVAPAIAPMVTPTPSKLSPAATRKLAEEQAKAQIPKFDKDAGGFITPPTPSNPNGTFVPLTAMQNSKDVQANVKALKMAGYDPTTGKDEISDLIEQSTGGVIQSGAAGTLGAFNITTSGADAIARLSTRVKAMTLSLLNGKLGAGISNADRDFIEGQFGDISNPNIASGKRLAAWDEAKKRMLSLGMLAMPDQPQAPAAAATTPTVAPVKITGNADYDKLPSGAVFIDPKGQQRRKP